MGKIKTVLHYVRGSENRGNIKDLLLELDTKPDELYVVILDPASDKPDNHTFYILGERVQVPKCMVGYCCGLLIRIMDDDDEAVAEGRDALDKIVYGDNLHLMSAERATYLDKVPAFPQIFLDRINQIRERHVYETKARKEETKAEVKAVDKAVDKAEDKAVDKAVDKAEDKMEAEDGNQKPCLCPVTKAPLDSYRERIEAFMECGEKTGCRKWVHETLRVAGELVEMEKALENAYLGNRVIQM